MVNSQDELDKRILDIMLSGKGISPRLSDLARELSRPRSTIDLRVRLLEDEKIIEGYRPVVNWKKLGYEIEGYVGVSCSEESVPALLDAIKNSDCCSVESVFEVTTGMFDILAKCMFRNYEGIKELRKLIHVMDGVKEVEVCLLGSCHKANRQQDHRSGTQGKGQEGLRPPAGGEGSSLRAAEGHPRERAARDAPEAKSGGREGIWYRRWHPRSNDDRQVEGAARFRSAGGLREAFGHRRDARADRAVGRRLDAARRLGRP